MNITGTGGGGVLLALSPDEVFQMLRRWETDTETLPLLLPGDQPTVAQEIRRESNRPSQITQGKAPAKGYPPGARVRLSSEMEGQVIGICLRASGHVSYECAWWKEGVRYTAWLEETEVAGEPGELQEIGFR